MKELGNLGDIEYDGEINEAAIAWTTVSWVACSIVKYLRFSLKLPTTISFAKLCNLTVTKPFWREIWFTCAKLCQVNGIIWCSNTGWSTRKKTCCKFSRTKIWCFCYGIFWKTWFARVANCTYSCKWMCTGGAIL